MVVFIWWIPKHASQWYSKRKKKWINKIRKYFSNLGDFTLDFFFLLRGLPFGIFFPGDVLRKIFQATPYLGHSTVISDFWINIVNIMRPIVAMGLLWTCSSFDRKSDGVKYRLYWSNQKVSFLFDNSIYTTITPYLIAGICGPNKKRLGRCGDAMDTIFEIILAALKYTLVVPLCISGSPGVFKRPGVAGTVLQSPPLGRG